MVAHRDKMSNTVKKQLYAEAGQKCANPGCPNRRTHIHHIREWAVYQTHDQEHMIAVCPACHDAIHHGAIRLDDAVVYQWKTISRKSNQVRSHIYVEPGEPVKVLLGSIAVASASRALIFQLSPLNRLSFTIKDGDILILDLSICTLEGQEILRVSDNHVKHNRMAGVEFQQIPGTIRVLTPCAKEFIPDWVLQQMRIQEPTFGIGGRLTISAISVLKPGLAQIEGVWAQKDKAVVVTQERLAFLEPDGKEPLSLVGEGVESVLFNVSTGIIDLPLFGFGAAASVGG
jgi:hypothetical protein